MENTTAPRLKLGPIGELFSGTWKTYKERFATLTEIMLLPVLGIVLAYILLSLGGVLAIVGSLVLIAGIIAVAFVSLPLMYSVHNGTGTDVSYRRTLPLFWPFVWLIILNALAVFGGFFMLVIPGIWLSIALGMSRYAFVIEERRGMDALRQSRDYVKGYWWAILGRSILLGILYMVSLLIVEGIFAVIFGRIGAAIAGYAVALFFAPFGVVFAYKIFMNLREIKPELAGVRTNERRTFLTVSAIVGLVMPVIIIVLVGVLAAKGVFTKLPHAAPYPYMTEPGYAPVPLQQ